MTSTDQQVCAELRRLVAAAGPAVTARPDLAQRVLAEVDSPASSSGRRSRRARTALGLLGVGIVAAGAVAAAGWTGEGRYVEWTQPSGSMTPTVTVSQRVVVDRQADARHGDVVLLTARDGGTEFETIKRVVGLPGDTVACPAGPDGTCAAVVVSGRPLAEPWQTSRTDPFPAVTVPAGEVFVLGDARPESADSRLWGTLPLTGVQGVVVARLAPDGSAQPVPGAPEHQLPDDVRVDPADPVPPAPAA